MNETSQRPSSPVAGFVDYDDHNGYSSKIKNILKESDIECMFLDYPLTTVFVDPRYKTKAIDALKSAIKKGEIKNIFGKQLDKAEQGAAANP